MYHVGCPRAVFVGCTCASVCVQKTDVDDDAIRREKYKSVVGVLGPGCAEGGLGLGFIERTVTL